MLKVIAFRGVSEVGDLIDIARQYDDPSVCEFPIGSGISYSRFFRPNAFREGWRLESEAGHCWAAVSNICVKRPGPPRLGMQWIASTIRNYLFSYWHLEHGFPAESGDMWREAIQASGVEDTLGVI